MNVIKRIVRYLKKILLSFLYRGDARFCPICNKSSGKFMPFGSPLRNDAQCVHCGSLERHRLTWLFLEQKTDLFDHQAKKMLHVAPEPVFEQLFSKELGEGYLTADLYNPAAMVKMDITDIQYPDETFDVIYCSHVLEYVPDDQKAMQEFYRVLKQKGWAILLVPIMDGATHEDLSITDPQERIRLYGQDDHVRRYGTDNIYLNRLQNAGFTVTVFQPSDLLDDEQITKMGITAAAQDIYYCSKQ